MLLNAPMCWFALAVCGVGWAAAAAADDVVALRQQYNQVSASIDTLVRLYGGDKLRELAKRKGNSRLLPADSKLVLIFWADDEAELFLNGHRIGETRLTPTRVEIPVSVPAPVQCPTRSLLGYRPGRERFYGRFVPARRPRPLAQGAGYWGRPLVGGRSAG